MRNLTLVITQPLTTVLRTNSASVILGTFLISAMSAASGIHDLAFTGDLAALKVKIDEDSSFLTLSDTTDRRLLHWACTGGKKDVVEYLLVDKKVEVDPKDDTNWTPLIIASSAGHLDIAKLLIGAGANVDACTDQGRSCLLYACSRNRLDVARLLLQNHADINLQDKLGAAPVHRASTCGHLKILQLLLEFSNQLDFSSGDVYGNTPLHLACEEGSVECVRLLLAAGADVRAQNRKEQTPIELARDEHLKVMGDMMVESERARNADDE